MKTLRTLRPTRIIGGLIFLCAALLYLRTTAPTLGGGFDSEEFQHVAYTFGIAHATGYPLYLLIGKIFTTLVPIGNIAYRMNLLSALIGAATVVVVYLNALTLTRRQVASIATAALFATNPAVWRQAGIASVGPLHLFFIATILYALLQRHAKRMPLSIAAVLFGLAMTHHRTIAWFASPIAILVLMDDPNILRRPRAIAKHLIILLAPLLLYLYLPLLGNNSPWYSNTDQGFFKHVIGGDAGDFIRTAPTEILEGISITSQYLSQSFGTFGAFLILLGAISIFLQRRQSRAVPLFLGTATLIYYLQGSFYAGEPDRYLQMPFAFLIYWFALGVGAVQNFIDARFVIPSEARNLAKNYSHLIASGLVAVTLTLLITLPFPDRFRIADWSTFDRTYKLWDEIFTLPIPENATIVGNWGQLNAMRYMQRVENRRPDLQFVGTLYDPAPQTQAAEEAFAQGRAIFIAPGLPLPIGTYRYAQLGPLLEVRDQPQTHAPATQKNIPINPTLTLADFEITTALEPYAPTTSIAPNRTARVTLDWRAESTVKDFLVRAKLYDPEARLVAQKDDAPVRGLYSPAQWQPGEFVRDVQNILIPAGSPPGTYTLKVQTLDAANRRPTSDEITLASFTIERVMNLTRDQVFAQKRIDLDLDPRVQVWGYGGLDNARRAGDILGINLIWHVRSDVRDNLTLSIALIDSNGNQIEMWKRAPIAFYPTREWKPGEILKAYYDLQIPAATPHGEFELRIGLGESHRTLGKIQIVP